MSYDNSTGDNSVVPRSKPRSEAASRFRIVVRQADGSVALITLCQTRSEARSKARLEVERHLARLRHDRQEVLLDRKRPSQVQMEQWIGHATCGQWKAVERNEGGYQFTFYDSPPRRSKSKNFRASLAKSSDANKEPCERQQNTLMPQCGDLVECLLLEKRTRKKGWFARVVGYRVEGPVTGSPPTSQALEAGMRLKLRVCSFKLSTGTAQLAWPQ